MFVALPVLLWSTSVLAAPPVETAAVEGMLRVEVGAEETRTRPIRIGPGVSTTLLFDTEIQQDQVSLESREQFARVSTGGSILVLIPSNDLQQGETLNLSIPFRDAAPALPSRLTLTLVVDSGAVDRQVEVYRRARSAESYRLEVQQLRMELERLRQERIPQHGGVCEQAGFRGLLGATTSFPGISVGDNAMLMHCSQSCSLNVEKSWTYTAGKRRAVMLLLRAVDKKPWTIGRAVLVDRKGREWESLPAAQSGPITSQSSATLLLEFDMNNPELDGYQLNVSDEDGGRTVQWSGIKFP
nr:DUF2381 family protein [Corallococcus macrosporus]